MLFTLLSYIHIYISNNVIDEYYGEERMSIFDEKIYAEIIHWKKKFMYTIDRNCQLSIIEDL
jgi:hypothetical protein